MFESKHEGHFQITGKVLFLHLGNGYTLSQSTELVIYFMTCTFCTLLYLKPSQTCLWIIVTSKSIQTSQSLKMWVLITQLILSYSIQEAVTEHLFIKQTFQALEIEWQSLPSITEKKFKSISFTILRTDNSLSFYKYFLSINYMHKWELGIEW